MKKQLYEVPRNKQVRIIIDTDAYAEGDDQYAIVHALLTPKFHICGIVAAHCMRPNSMNDSYNEIKKVLKLMELEADIPVYKGSEEAIKAKNQLIVSEGSKFIIEEANKSDDRPLFILNMGAVTNLATALSIDSTIADKMIAVWIGGGSYPKGNREFNSGNDIKAANILLSSTIELWQIPVSAYTMMEVSFHELWDRVQPYGKIGAYLYNNLLRVNEVECAMNFEEMPFYQKASQGARTMIIRSGEGWSLGDSPAVGVLITSQSQDVEHINAMYINEDGTYGQVIEPKRIIRVYHHIDSRIILEDMFAKIKYYCS